MLDYDEMFAAHREHLWGLCYRVTGSAADAEDLVQETFVRVMKRPPPDLDRPLRPWLARVATNLAIDALRKRKSRPYIGPYLPSVVESPAGATHGELAEDGDVEARYGLLESATAAFLFAAEVLTPVQRAALMLRDVLGYTGPETAAILETTAENVRVMIFRARRTLAAYDRERSKPGTDADAVAAEVLARLFGALTQGDVATARACLAADAFTVSDAGGGLRAATKVVRGADNVTALLRGLAVRGSSRVLSAAPVRVNGLPAMLLRLREAEPRDATSLLIQADVGPRGTIRRIFLWLAPTKLGRFSDPTGVAAAPH